jgi:hypothetical protein
VAAHHTSPAHHDGGRTRTSRGSSTSVLRTTGLRQLGRMLPVVLLGAEGRTGDHTDVDVGAGHEVVSHQRGGRRHEKHRQGRGRETLQGKYGMKGMDEMRETEVEEARAVRAVRGRTGMSVIGVSGMKVMMPIPDGGHRGIQRGQATSRPNLRGRPDRENGMRTWSGGEINEIEGGIGTSVMWTTGMWLALVGRIGESILTCR